MFARGFRSLVGFLRFTFMSASYSQLKAFHAVAVHGGFSRAAEKLCLSQPAISDQVRKLEAHFEVALFHRNRRQVQLTEPGRELLAITQRMFAAEAEADELLRSHGALQRGSLALSVDSAVHLLPALACFSRAYPGIRLKLAAGNSSQSLTRLFDYQADLAVVGWHPDDGRLLSMKLAEHPIVAFAAAGHPWAARRQLSLVDLAGLPLILREQGSHTRQVLEEEMQRAGLGIEQAIEVEGREAVSELVAAGVGVGIVSAAELGGDTRLCAIEIRDCTRRMPEYLVTLREHESRSAIRAFLASVRQAQPVS
ncbi:HTH lysR-type domain-containing protein [Kerstersia similis]